MKRNCARTFAVIETRPEATDVGADHFMDGALVLRQPVRGHRVGTDAVLLAAAIATPEGCVIDAGAGIGAVGLMLARRAPTIDVTLVEVDPLSAALARENIDLNGFGSRARVVEADLVAVKSRRAAGLVDQSADLILTNPPWLTPGRSRPSPDGRRALAHIMGAEGLTGWLRGIAALTRPDGRMAIIAPAQSLAELLGACAGRFGDLAILPLHPRANEPAIRLLAVGRKGSRAGLRLLPGLVLHTPEGAFTPLVEALHRGKATLDLK